MEKAWYFVSIPSSSGQYFRQDDDRLEYESFIRRFQSLLHQGSTSDSTMGTGSPCAGIGRFNPFFIRAVLQTGDNRAADYHLDHDRFQSLLHQGSTSDDKRVTTLPPRKRSQFQSLLHQGSTSDQYDMFAPTQMGLFVSIPSSSGQYFRPIRASLPDAPSEQGFNPFFIRAVLQTCVCWENYICGQCGFQSLLHQGSTSDVEDKKWHTFNFSQGFNPFFIRAVLQTNEDRKFDPARQHAVSIPSSSGQYFRRASTDRSDGLGSVWVFQSLLHQGSTSDMEKGSAVTLGNGVSIPSSSGQYFRQRIRKFYNVKL